MTDGRAMSSLDQMGFWACLGTLLPLVRVNHSAWGIGDLHRTGQGVRDRSSMLTEEL